MARKRKMKTKQGGVTNRAGRAEPHSELANNKVHVFVDDQNLFWGIVNNKHGRGFRIDFGKLLLAAAHDSLGNTREVASAYIAGVIPEDDSFWNVAENCGFAVRRGYLGSDNRSKQDDSYLIVEMVTTLYENEGPSTVVLVAGDADYGPPLKQSLKKGWRNEVAFTDKGVSAALESVAHEFRIIDPFELELIQ